MVPVRGGLRALSGMDPLARGVCMPPVRRAKVLANGAWPIAVPRMPTPNLGQSRDCFRGYAKVVAFVVSCDVVDDGAEDGVKCKELV